MLRDVTHVVFQEYGETLCSVPEVISEIRDKEARRRLEALPFPITMRQPQPHSIKFGNHEWNNYNWAISFFSFSLYLFLICLVLMSFH